jgi:hypothetical protein
MTKTEYRDYAKLWEQFKIYLKKEIGWYEVATYKPMNAQEFIAEHGKQMSDEFKTFMTDNVLLVNRQLDAYAIYFVGEEIPQGD